jgi:hypothetical protein
LKFLHGTIVEFGKAVSIDVTYACYLKNRLLLDKIYISRHTATAVDSWGFLFSNATPTTPTSRVWCNNNRWDTLQTDSGCFDPKSKNNTLKSFCPLCSTECYLIMKWNKYL